MTRLTLAVITAAILPGHAIAGEEWTPLFDGKSFAGWTFEVLDHSAPESIWSVKDGVIQVGGKDHPTGVLRTAKAYADYELEFEWRWPAGEGNSGCLIHCSTPREMNVWPKSLEVQLQSGNAGDFIHIGETIEVRPEQVAVVDDPKSWMVRLRRNLTDDSEKPLGEWNRMRIIAKGAAVEVHVNGTLVNKGWNGSASSGAICLQAEKADIQFRNVRIRQLE